MTTSPGTRRPGRHHHRGRASRRLLPDALSGVLAHTGRVLAVLLSVTCLAASAWGWYNFRQLNRNEHQISIGGLGEPTFSGGAAAATQQVDGTAQNILIVGIDSRAGLTAKQRRYLKVGNDSSTSTDTIMLVHVPADGSKATLISIPRDSWVHIPGHPDAKINAAYIDGYLYGGAHGATAQQEKGATTLVTTVKQLTGVPIDHYVQVGFGGFEQIVKAVGSIPITLCKSVDDTHAYNVAHGEDGGSGFHMSAGFHKLDPQQALEFVRQRHNIPGKVTDDLGRELRQRYFLSAAFKKILSAGVLFNPVKLHNLINAIDGAFTFDNNGFDLTKFAEQMTSLSAGHIVGRSIPTDGNITVDGQDALKVVPSQVRKAVHDAFYGSHPSTHRHHHKKNAGLTAPADQSCVD
jgi:LCP family protein required for cell wall assembly